MLQLSSLKEKNQIKNTSFDYSIVSPPTKVPLVQVLPGNCPISRGWAGWGEGQREKDGQKDQCPPADTTVSTPVPLMNARLMVCVRTSDQ